MAAYDTYAAALAPYVTTRVNNVPNLSGAIQKMIDYNSKMNLGLTDEQIVAGIQRFGSGHVQQFGTGVTQQSNYNAVAAESIMRALELAGKDAAGFWNNVSKDAYPVTSDGTIPGMPSEGGSWATKVVRGMPDQNWDYDHGGMRSVSDPLEKAVNNWISNDPTKFHTAEAPTNVVQSYTDQRPMTFSDAQRKAVADTMRSFNSVLGLGLTDEQMATGINKFSGAQYQIYQQGYNVGSDPYNIARWSLWNALNDTGKTAVGDSLIEKTNAKQALTATQAEELYNKANGWVTDTYGKIEAAREKASDEGGFFGHLKNMAPGVLTIAGLFSGIAGLLGPAGGVAAGTSAAGSLAESLGLGDVYNSFSSLVGDAAKGIIDITGATGNAAKAITTGVNSAVTSGTTAALTGGDLGDIAEAALIGGATGAGASYVGNTVLEGLNGAPVQQMPAPVTDAATYNGDTLTGLNNTVAGAAAGATGGLIGSTLSGADSTQIGNAVLTGAAAGGAGGLITDAGGGFQTGQAAGNVVGGVVANELQDTAVTTDTAATTDTAGTDTTVTETDTRTHDYALDWGNSPSFATLLVPSDRAEGRMNWGTRLNNGRPA